MRHILGLVALGISFQVSAQTVSYSLCNEFGIDTVNVLVKDKKNNMAVVYNGPVAKNDCVSVRSSAGTGSHAEIEVKVNQGVAYGVPWINPGDKVKF